MYFSGYILIQLNSAFYRKGLLITARKEILKTYAENDLLIDVITLVPLHIAYTMDYFWLQGVFLLQIKRLARLIKKNTESLHMSEYGFGILSLFKLLLIILYMAHLCGCIW